MTPTKIRKLSIEISMHHPGNFDEEELLRLYDRIIAEHLGLNHLIRIDRCTDSGSWYSQLVGKIIPFERLEICVHQGQGIPEDVYWCREGGTYNPINWVRRSDATEL